MELDAIAAVAVGGTLLTGGRATVVGTLLGALIIQLVRYTLLANGVPDAAALVVKALIIVLAVWLQRRGARHERQHRRRWPAVYSGLSARQGVLVALVLLILFGWLRYDYFLGAFNVLSVLRYNSHVRAGRARHVLRDHDRRHRPVGRLDGGHGERRRGLLQPIRRRAPASLAGVGAGARRSACSTALIVTRLGILPFIATLATMLAASGTGLLLAGNQSVSVSYDTGFTELGQGDLLGLPDPGLDRRRGLSCAGSLVLNLTAFGRTVLAVGGGEDATRLMGLPVDRVKSARLRR